MAIQGDVSCEADVLRLFETTERELGPIRALVNNAAITGGFARVDKIERGGSRANAGGERHGNHPVRAGSRTPDVDAAGRPVVRS